MSFPRQSAAVATIDDKLYVVGGYSSGGNRLKSVERYDPVTNTWEAVAEMSTQRKMPCVAVLDGMLYAMGGHNGTNYLSSVERFDPATNTWEAAAAMSIERTWAGVVAM